MNHDSVLQIIKTRGPVIPSQISKDLGTNILLASAILSDFASRNLVKVSSIRIGGSPLYYVIGQEDRLQQYMDRLQEKEKKACELLKEKKVLRDEALEPVDRYSLRQCKDFAKPIEVTVDGRKELFWKWYLSPNEEIEPLIRREIMPQEKRPPETRKADTRTAESQRIPEQKLQQKPELKPEKPIVEKTEREAPRISQAIKQALHERQLERAEEKLQLQQLKKAEPEQAVERRPKTEQDFSQRVKSFFSQKGITIVEEQQPGKKGSDSMRIVKVPSAVGDMTYISLSKNKAKCNEADLSYAYVQGQQKQLPVLFITAGEPTKKAKELLQSGALKNLVHIQV